MRIGVQPDVAVLAGEPQREPALRLAAIAPAERHADQFRRQVVGQPVGMLADDLGAIGADLLRQFAQHRGARVLVRIDAALRQLPAAGRAFGVRQVGTAGDEHAAVPVEQHGADIRPVRAAAPDRSIIAGGGCTSALTGASARPSAASPLPRPRCAARSPAGPRRPGRGRSPSRAPAARAAPACRRSRRAVAGSSITMSTVRAPHQRQRRLRRVADRRTAGRACASSSSTGSIWSGSAANRSPRICPSAPVAPT